MARAVADGVRAHVEDWGLLFEESGMPRMAGRVLGALITSARGPLSAAEIEARLGASKGSINQTTRLLERGGLVERRIVPGERFVRFAVPDDAFARLFRAKFGGVGRWRVHAERGLQALEGAPREQTAALRGMRELYAFLEQELAGVLARWDARSRAAATERRRR